MTRSKKQSQDLLHSPMMRANSEVGRKSGYPPPRHNEISRHPFAHRACDDFAAVPVCQVGKIQLTRVGRDIGDVAVPAQVRHRD